MRIEIDRDRLLSALRRAAKMTQANSPVPVFRNVLIEERGGKARIAGQNERFGIEIMVGAGIGEAGAVTFPAKQIVPLVAGLPAGSVTLEAEHGDPRTTVRAGKIRYRLETVAAEEFPEFPEAAPEVTARMPLQTAQDAILSVLAAVGSDATRPALTGVCWSSKENGIEIAATDTHRLATRRLLEGPFSNPAEGEKRYLIPQEPLRDLVSWPADNTSELLIEIGEGQARFSADGAAVTTRLIASAFPKYERMFGEPAVCTWEFNAAEMVAILKRVNIVAGEDLRPGSAGQAVFSPGDSEIMIAARVADFGEAEEEIAATIKGDACRMFFNVNYLISFLDLYDGTASIRFTDATGCGKTYLGFEEAPEFSGIVMPLSPEKIPGEDTGRPAAAPKPEPDEEEDDAGEAEETETNGNGAGETEAGEQAPRKRRQKVAK